MTTRQKSMAAPVGINPNASPAVVYPASGNPPVQVPAQVPSSITINLNDPASLARTATTPVHAAPVHAAPANAFPIGTGNLIEGLSPTPGNPPAMRAILIPQTPAPGAAPQKVQLTAAPLSVPSAQEPKKSFWEGAGKWILISVVVILIGILAYFLFRNVVERQKQKTQQQQEQFQQSVSQAYRTGRDSGYALGVAAVTNPSSNSNALPSDAKPPPSSHRPENPANSTTSSAAANEQDVMQGQPVGINPYAVVNNYFSMTPSSSSPEASEVTSPTRAPTTAHNPAPSAPRNPLPTATAPAPVPTNATSKLTGFYRSNERF